MWFCIFFMEILDNSNDTINFVLLYIYILNNITKYVYVNSMIYIYMKRIQIERRIEIFTRLEIECCSLLWYLFILAIKYTYTRRVVLCIYMNWRTTRQPFWLHLFTPHSPNIPYVSNVRMYMYTLLPKFVQTITLVWHLEDFILIYT